jgi:hypothetical protein
MKKVALIALFAVVLVGVAFAQQPQLKSALQHQTAGHHSIDAFGNKIEPQSRYGATLWNNMASSGWFTGQGANYLYLDWGFLNGVDGNGLPGEPIDAYAFGYAGNDTEADGLDYALYWFDQASGWGDVNIVQESGLLFTGLWNSRRLDPAYYWGWLVTTWFDVGSQMFEFLLDEGDIVTSHGSGISFALELYETLDGGAITGPLMSQPPGYGGNTNTQTQDVFNIFYPNGAFKGNYWFGGYPANPWSSWRAALYGGSDTSANMTYDGFNLAGNTTYLYNTGSWAGADNVHFMLKKNQITNQPGRLLGDTKKKVTYYAITGTTFYVNPFTNYNWLMNTITISDHYWYNLTVPTQYAGARAYFQGCITGYFGGGGPTFPIDNSNGTYSN